MIKIKNGFEFKDKKAEPTFLTADFLPIPKNAITMLSAAGGTGKSFLSLQVAIKVILENPQRRVLVWSSEDDIGYIIDRFYKIARHILTLQTEEIEKILKQIDFVDAEELPPHLNALSKEKFESLIQTFAKYRLVVLDPLIAFFKGDENSNSEARNFMNLLNSSVKKYKFTILLIHHHNKDKEMTRTRGASAFVDAVRLLYSVTVKDEKQLKTNKRLIKIEKDNLGVRALQNFKDKNEFDLEILPYSVSASGVSSNDSANDDDDMPPEIPEFEELKQTQLTAYDVI